MSEVRIFVTYYKNKSDAPIIKSSVFQPIMAGSAEISGKINDAFLRDDTGDNISNLNKNYGELTIHYWLLKNYITSSEEKYLGVCHYRRFLEFCGESNISLGKESKVSPLKLVYFKYFIDKAFSRFSENSILSTIGDYDVVNTPKWDFDNKSNRVVFDFYHRSSEMNLAVKALERINPEYSKYVPEFFEDNKGYYCMCAVMKKDLLKDYFEFEFKLLDEMTKDSSASRWEKYEGYYDVRMPAFIMERLYNVWLRYMIDKEGIKVLDLPACKLVSPKEVSPAKRVEFIKKLSMSEKKIDPYYYDTLSAKHLKLNKVIKLLVKKDDYSKLLGDPRGFFFDGQCFLIRLLGTLYK